MGGQKAQSTSGGTFAGSSLVHPHETTQPDYWLQEVADESSEVQAQQIDSAFAKFRHSGWQRLRARVRHCLTLSGESDARIRKFDNCGSFCCLQQSPSTCQVRICGNFCKNRWCVPCTNARSHIIKENLARFIEEKCVRFLTFTLHQNGKERLEQMLNRLRRSLTLLYRRDDWKSHVSGWCTFIEIKRSSRHKQWHVHAHVLAEGSFWEQRDLSREWHACTGDSFIVDIRAVTDPKGGAFYAAKYASKPCNVGDLESDEQLQEAIKCVGHRRLYSIGGSWKGKLKLREKLDAPTDFVFIGWIDQIIADARADLLPAVMICKQVLRWDPSHEARAP